MTDEPWLITENEAFIYRGGLVALTYDELLAKVKKLEHENDELRQRIAELERELAISRHPSNQ